MYSIWHEIISVFWYVDAVAECWRIRLECDHSAAKMDQWYEKSKWELFLLPIRIPLCWHEHNETVIWYTIHDNTPVLLNSEVKLADLFCFTYTLCIVKMSRSSLITTMMCYKLYQRDIPTDEAVTYIELPSYMFNNSRLLREQRSFLYSCRMRLSFIPAEE